MALCVCLMCTCVCTCVYTCVSKGLLPLLFRMLLHKFTSVFADMAKHLLQFAAMLHAHTRVGALAGPFCYARCTCCVRGVVSFIFTLADVLVCVLFFLLLCVFWVLGLYAFVRRKRRKDVPCLCVIVYHDVPCCFDSAHHRLLFHSPLPLSSSIYVIQCMY